MKYNNKDLNDNIGVFQKGRSALASYGMEVVDDVNDINPLAMLRFYEEEPSVDNMAALASQFLINKTIVFTHHDAEILRFTFAGGDLGAYFAAQPFLLDICLKYCYSILLKKLAAPSKSFALSEQPSVK